MFSTRYLQNLLLDHVKANADGCNLYLTTQLQALALSRFGDAASALSIAIRGVPGQKSWNLDLQGPDQLCDEFLELLRKRRRDVFDELTINVS